MLHMLSTCRDGLRELLLGVNDYDKVTFIVLSL